MCIRDRRELDYEKFAEIGNEVGALLVADVAHIAGLIAGGLSLIHI